MLPEYLLVHAHPDKLRAKIVASLTVSGKNGRVTESLGEILVLILFPLCELCMRSHTATVTLILIAGMEGVIFYRCDTS